MELIAKIVVPKYPREVTVSKSVRPKFYIREEMKKELLLKYCHKKHYKETGERKLNEQLFYWHPDTVTRNKKRVTRHFLTNRFTGEREVSNSKKVGKKKTKVINGQDLIRLTLPTYMFSKIKELLKRDFKLAIKKSGIQPITDYPLIIKCELFDTVNDELIASNPRWDVDNRFLMYGKYFLDTLKNEGIIEDDDRLHITSPPSVLFTPVRSHLERKMVFEIYRDTRPEIMFNPDYDKTWNTKKKTYNMVQIPLL